MVVPMSIALVWGLIFATVLTLVFVPSLYLILEDIKNKYNNWPLWLKISLSPLTFPLLFDFLLSQSEKKQKQTA